jgi:hypothetical protein
VDILDTKSKIQLRHHVYCRARSRRPLVVMTPIVVLKGRRIKSYTTETQSRRDEQSAAPAAPRPSC